MPAALVDSLPVLTTLIAFCKSCHLPLIFFCPIFPLSKTNKDKSVPLQAWSGPECSRKLRFPDFMTTAQDGGKVVNLTHRPPLPHRKYTWYSFLLEAESTPGP